MANLFLGFPVPRAKIASMIEGTAPPSNHHTQHELGGSDEIDCTGLTGAGGMSLPLADFWLDDHWVDDNRWNQTLVGSGSITRASNKITVATGATQYSQAKTALVIPYPIPTMTWDKERHLVIRVKPTVPAFAMEDMPILFGMDTTQQHIGFHFLSGYLYGTNRDASNTTQTQLINYSVPADYVEILLHAKFYPGDRVEFYGDGALLGTSTTNLPSGTSLAENIGYIAALNNMTTEDCKLEFNHIQFYQEG